MTESTPEEITDDFLTNLQKGNYRMNPNVVFKHTYSHLDDAKTELMSALSQYTQLRYDPASVSKLRLVAIVCVEKIRKAWIEDLIREKPSDKAKIKAVELENTNLKELNNKLAKENDHLKKQVTALHETIDRLTAKGLNKASGENP